MTWPDPSARTHGLAPEAQSTQVLLVLTAGDIAFATLAINPIGGLAIAIPFAIFKLHDPVWFVIALSIPLAYVQVVVVDLSWTTLARMPWWFRFLERSRSKRIEQLTASRGAFWLTALISPLAGPWLVMAFMRYANISQRKVALPLILGLCWMSAILCALCVYLPHLF